MTNEVVLMEQVQGEKIEKYEMIERHEVEDTPFTIVTTDKGSFVGMGRFRLTEFMEYDQCESVVFTKDWKFLLTVISVLVEELSKKK